MASNDSLKEALLQADDEKSEVETAPRTNSPRPRLASPLGPPQAPSAFVRFKENCSTLGSMGFTIELAQQAIFQAVQRGVPPNQQVQAALEALLDGTVTEEIAQARAEGSANELGSSDTRRMSANDVDFSAESALPSAPPQLRRAASDPASDRAKRIEARAAIKARENMPTHAKGVFKEIMTMQPISSSNTDGTAEGPLLSCLICFDEITADTRVEMAGHCGHFFCSSCIAGWLSASINDGNLELRCPLATTGPPPGNEGAYRCRGAPPLGPQAIEQLIWSAATELTPPFTGLIPSLEVQIASAQAASDLVQGGIASAVAAASAATAAEALEADSSRGPRRPQLLSKYRRFRLQQALDGDSRVIWCPASGCGAPLVRNVWTWTMFGRGRRVDCACCRQAACSDCGRPFHGTSSCEVFLKNELIKK